MRYNFLLILLDEVLTTHQTEVQSVVTPITSKIYAGANAPGPDDDEDPIHDHDEL